MFVVRRPACAGRPAAARAAIIIIIIVVVARPPACLLLQELSEEELVQVLTGPRNALVKQYRQLFALNKARFGVTSGALRAIAGRARAKGTGTRSLRSLLEGLLTDAMYDVPEAGPAAAAEGRCGAAGLACCGAVLACMLVLLLAASTSWCCACRLRKLLQSMVCADGLALCCCSWLHACLLWRRPIGVLLDEAGVLDGSGGRIVGAEELDAVMAADAAAASDAGEPIAAEVR